MSFVAKARDPDLYDSPSTHRSRHHSLSPSFGAFFERRSTDSGCQPTPVGYGYEATNPRYPNCCRRYTTYFPKGLSQQGSGCIIHLNIATCQWWLPFIWVEKATCFEWLQNEFLLGSPVDPKENRSNAAFSGVAFRHQMSSGGRSLQ